jgi:NADP-dependent 3-hydroxy acid dehydrogenase YdfG
VADLDAWERMYAVNVIGTTRVTQALLPRLVANAGQVVFVTSTAADAPYEGGAGYCGSKAAERMVAGAMRLELVDSPVRVHDVAPGMVRTDEFALNRYAGDQARAEAVYAGVAEPLVAEDVAEVIRWIASLPSHVDVDRLTLRPRAQAAQHKVSRVFDQKEQP